MYGLPRVRGVLCGQVLGAWNFPFQVTLGPVIAALCAGNTVVLKPSELAPSSARLMATLVPKCVPIRAWLFVVLHHRACVIV